MIERREIKGAELGQVQPELGAGPFLGIGRVGCSLAPPAKGGLHISEFLQK